MKSDGFTPMTPASTVLPPEGSELLTRCAHTLRLGFFIPLSVFVTELRITSNQKSFWECYRWEQSKIRTAQCQKNPTTFGCMRMSVLVGFDSAEDKYNLHSHPASMALAAMAMASVLKWIPKRLIKYLSSVLLPRSNRIGTLHQASFGLHLLAILRGFLIVSGMTLCARPFKKILLLETEWFGVTLALISSPEAFMYPSEFNTTRLLSGQGFEIYLCGKLRQISHCYMWLIALQPWTCGSIMFIRKPEEITSSLMLSLPWWSIVLLSQSTPLTRAPLQSLSLCFHFRRNDRPCMCMCVCAHVCDWMTCVLQRDRKGLSYRSRNGCYSSF